MAVAPPRQHVIDSPTSLQRAASKASEPSPRGGLLDTAAPSGAPEIEQSVATSPPAAGEDNGSLGLSGDADEDPSTQSAAEVVRWWADRIELSDRGTLVRAGRSAYCHVLTSRAISVSDARPCCSADQSWSRFYSTATLSSVPSFAVHCSQNSGAECFLTAQARRTPFCVRAATSDPAADPGIVIVRKHIHRGLKVALGSVCRAIHIIG